jgi:hypothetical protein
MANGIGEPEEVRRCPDAGATLTILGVVRAGLEAADGFPIDIDEPVSPGPSPGTLAVPAATLVGGLLDGVEFVADVAS